MPPAKKKSPIEKPERQARLLVARPEALAALTIEADVLRLAVERADLVMPRKDLTDTSAYYRHIHVSAARSEVSMVATDTLLGCRAKYAAVVHKPGEFLIPANAFQVFRTLRKQVLLEVVWEREDFWLIVSSGETNYTGRFKTQEAKGFLDNLPGSTYTDSIEVREALLIGMLKRTVFSISSDDSKYGLNALLIEISDQDDRNEHRPAMFMRFVSTDGHRLSRIESRLEQPVSGTRDAMLSRELLQAWMKVWTGDNINQSPLLKLELGESFARVVDGELEVWGRLLEGDFPDYRQVVLRSVSTLVNIPLGPLKDMCKRALLMSTEKQCSIRLHIEPDSEPEKGTLRVRASNPDLGEYHEHLPGVDIAKMQLRGEPFKVGLNPKYVIEALEALDIPRARLCFTGALSVVVVDDASDPTIQYALMPMRLE